MAKTALITGVTGQDGSYLCELLMNKGYEVHGIIRRSSTFSTQRIEHLYRDSHEPGTRLKLHYGDLLDASGLRRVISECTPDEVYNLGAQSHVRTSFDQPIYTAQTIAIGTLNLLEALRDYRDSMKKDVRIYQAGSSEMFGNTRQLPQSEATPFHPRSPYACAKVHAFWQTVNQREAYDLFACNGILFNHESPRRGETFVTRKITRAATRIKHGLQSRIYLGNLDAKRDWGFAGDFVEAMWMMLQQHDPDDFVVGTGEAHSVREFLDESFGYLDLDWHEHVEIDPRYYRPTEVNVLQADASKARNLLGWKPRITFKALVRMMIDGDMRIAQREHALAGSGVVVP